ncbi:fimbrial protein [Acinetobacter gerneri]|uniref:Uncharacterized protein n=1 Tax=Acinetobacter gerneri DSM 14967 = CIP 107464 = MTCC 9824 TaxID=1120926 RepID=N8ZLY6_9GAMM|nr:fimbrial protein [Acinetobacter gerneri]ENV34754.1 hypothetical protein F960_01062 [Acinetobacter gerneri DSM 14967 = CIP 107464 = MTCC 9824]EPR83255.1 Fimbrial protein [Acinetobacter gerneri DSM 14967 = CIP 107464 = MTCC 9824]
MKNKLIVSASSVFALFLWSNSSFAACKLKNNNFVAQNVVMDIGSVTISPDSLVGEILYTGSFTINERANVASCSNGGGSSIGKILIGSPVQTTLGNVYSTNITGIGVRLYRDSGEIQSYYPHEIKFDNTNEIRLVGGKFKVDIVKTAMTTGTGALSSGLYSTYYFNGDGQTKPVLTSTLNANGIVITNPTCVYRDGTDGQTVELDKVSAKELTGVGSVAKQKDFWIKLSCNGGNTKDQKLNLSFAYTADPSAGTNGVMKNTVGSGYATGVGIQILREDGATKVKNGDKINVSTVNKNTASNPELKLKAQYYQTAAQVNPGKVFTSATVTISYE